MSSRVGASGVPGPSGAGDHGHGDTGEEVTNNNNNNNNSSSSSSKAHAACRAARQRPRDAGPAGEVRSGGLEHLVRPPLPGRKAHREAHRGRWREGARDREEAEHGADRERRGGRRRWSGRAETLAGSPAPRQGEGVETLSGSDSDAQSSEGFEGGEGSSSQMGRSASTVGRAACSPPLRPSARNGSASLPPGTPAEELQRRYPRASSREPGPFRAAARTGPRAGALSQHQHAQTPSPSVRRSEQGEEDEEEEGEEAGEGEQGGEAEEGEEGDGGGGGVIEVTSQSATPAAARPRVPPGERRMSKREKNRMKCLRRRQRRREVWRQGQLQESQQSSTGNASSSSSSSSSSEDDDEAAGAGEREGYICAVCLDVYFSPYMCHPCNHIFCEPCLRTLARNSPANTPCPLCRTVITHVFFQKELNQTARTFFPKEYLSRKQNFQKASCAKWPLPSCRKLFHIFGGFQRQPAAVARRQLPRGGGYQLDGLDFRGDARGWRLDMDMVIIYIYSVNWVVGFFVFCFLCYLFFPSF